MHISSQLSCATCWLILEVEKNLGKTETETWITAVPAPTEGYTVAVAGSAVFAGHTAYGVRRTPVPVARPTCRSNVTPEGYTCFTPWHKHSRAIISHVVVLSCAVLVCHSRCYMSRRARNKRMHALNGNTSTTGGTARVSATRGSAQPLSLACLNVGGFHNSTKWLSLRNHPADLLVLSETQLQRHLHASICTEFSAYPTILSPGQDEKHFTGVAVFAKRTRFWAARTVTWPSGHPCHRMFWADNRLLCTQLWCGAGDTSIFCYAVYCPSGACWEAPKKAYTHALLQSIRDDVIQRGDVVAILAGDLNLQVEDSFLLRPSTIVVPKPRPTCEMLPHATKARGPKLIFSGFLGLPTI